MRKKPKGCIGAIVTSLKQNGDLNEEGMRQLVNHFIENGVHGLFPSGTQGEAPLLSKEERKEVIKWVIDETNGRVPVYAGTGCISTQGTLDLTRYAKDVGADGVVLITPFYIKPSKEELYHHFKTIAEAVDIPIVIYNNPGRTGGVNVTPNLLFRLAEFDNIVGIKDSTGDVQMTAEYIQKCGDRMSIVEGIDSLALPALILGADGLISGPAFCIAPENWIGLYESFVKGDLQMAKRLQYKLLPLEIATCRPATLGTYPVAVKEAMNMIGLPAGPPRKPLMPLTEERKQELKRILKDSGLILHNKQ